MSIPIAEFNFVEKTYTIVKGVHLYEKRFDNSINHRDACMTERTYKRVMLRALAKGLTSFREKGKTVISFMEETGRPISILVALNDDNRIFVVSVFRGKVGKSMFKGFIKESNRINLMDYTQKEPTTRELQKRKEEKLMFEATLNTHNENKEFKRFADGM